jgi:S1-C subfamily serine protease
LNALDLVILAVAAAAAVGGYRLGFLTRSVSWFGMAVGLFLASHLLPGIVRRMSDADRVMLLFVTAAVLIGGAFFGQAIGLLLGGRLHLALPRGAARKVDRAAGGVAGVLGVVVAVWLLLPSMAEIPDWPSRQARNSVIARAIDGSLPRAPLEDLRTLVGKDLFPRVFAELKPAPALGPPPAAAGLDEATTRRVAAATVKIQGVACRRIQEGSGFAVEPDIIVTNAHVVAGERDVSVERSDGTSLDADVVVFAPDRDLAVLHVDRLAAAPLPIADIGEGGKGAVFGHPAGGPLRIAPFQIGREVTATGTDIYDRHQTRRAVFFLSADLHPGDSGAALVDTQGRAVGVAFAIAPDRPGVAYALTTDELNGVLAAPRRPNVDTGACLG